MTSTVRPAKAEDIPVLVAIYGAGAIEQENLKRGWATQASWGESAADVIADVIASATMYGFPATAFVGEIDGQVLAYVLASLEPFPGGMYEGSRYRLRIHHLLVEEMARGVGIGELLLAAVAEWGKSNGAAICDMEVLPGHRSAKNFCEAHGLKARSITMSGVIEEILSSIEVDPDEQRALSQAVEDALSRKSASAAKKMEIAAGCIVVAKGCFLLARRDEEPFAGWWSIPGGRPYPGEPLGDCARREVLEETGVSVNILGIAGLAERSWEAEAAASSSWLIVNFIGVPEKPDDFSGHGRYTPSADIAWARIDALPEPLVPGVEAFLDRAIDAIDAASASRPLPAAIYSPPEDAC